MSSLADPPRAAKRREPSTLTLVNPVFGALPDRYVKEIAPGLVQLSIAGSVPTPIGDAVNLAAAEAQARAVLAGAPVGVPPVLFDIALALVALAARERA